MLKYQKELIKKLISLLGSYEKDTKVNWKSDLRDNLLSIELRDSKSCRVLLATFDLKLKSQITCLNDLERLVDIIFIGPEKDMPVKHHVIPAFHGRAVAFPK